MLDRLAALVVDEGKWLPASMAAAAAAVWWQLRRQAPDTPRRRQVESAMTLFFAVMVGTMAFGHLAAVTTKQALGTLTGSRLAFYAIGIALALPSWWLTAHALRPASGPGPPPGSTAVGLTVWTVATLLVLGLHNLPLAAPGLFALGYRAHARPAVGLVVVGLAAVTMAGLFVGSLVFMASGQTFEQFRGLEPRPTAVRP